MRASNRVASSTLIWFTTTPAFMPSSTQERYAGCMRYMVEHGHTTESRQNTVLSGFSCAMRLTQADFGPHRPDAPGRSLLDDLDYVLSRTVEVGGLDHLRKALRVHDDVDLGVLLPRLLNLGDVEPCVD